MGGQGASAPGHRPPERDDLNLSPGNADERQHDGAIDGVGRFKSRLPKT